MTATDKSCGSTEVLRREPFPPSLEPGTSTVDIVDLHALKAWLETQPTSNTTRVLSAFASLAIDRYSANSEQPIEEIKLPWSRIQNQFATNHNPGGPTALSQFLKMGVLNRWFEARSADYTQHCKATEATPLTFVEYPGKPLLYGFSSIPVRGAEMSFMLEGAIMRWRREIVPVDHISAIARIFYPDGRFQLQGWRYRIMMMNTFLQIGLFMLSGLSAALFGLSIPVKGPSAALLFLFFTAVTWMIYHWLIKPVVRESEIRTYPARAGTTNQGGPAWVDRTNVNLGRDKSDPYYQHSAIISRHLVRWKADCPICGSPVELRTNSPVDKGLVGCCVESPDEHSFTFDRVTLEGRALRSRPAQRIG